MIRNLLLVCALLFVSSLSIYSLSSGDSRADFAYVNPSGIHTLDPVRMSWTPDFRIALNIWEGLTTSDPVTTEPIDGAALFPPDVSSDRLTYKFTIRDDARWSNGDSVVAADFVRGWRRGLEPGTAGDYQFLFTDHLAGAREYLTWRRAGVAELTSLSRIRDGWTLTPDQARALARCPTFSQIHATADSIPEPPAQDAADLAWQRFADKLDGLSIDWNACYEAAFAAHISEMDQRFTKVGVRASGKRELTVRLARPCPYFLDITAFPTLLPCHESIERLRERYRKAPITAEGLVVYDPQWTKPDYRRNGYPGLISNGPYRLADWRFKRRARLGVNRFHRTADAIACRTVDMVVYDNVSAAIMAYEAGDLDFLPTMDVPYDHEIARLAQSGARPDFHLCQTFATYFLSFNCVSATVGGKPNPFIDPRVRRAFSLAVDKAKIVNNVLKRGDRVARSFVPAGTIAGYEPPIGLRRDVPEARRLLAEAGYEDGRGLPPIELLYVTADERICQALARMWERDLGVRVELRSKESKTFAEDKANHRYMIARGNWYGDYHDPTTFLDCLITGNGNNDSGYSGAAYDVLMSRASTAADPTERAELLQGAERILVEEDCPILPILHYAQPIAIKPYVKGLHANARLRFPFCYVSIER